jgi:hypothetical protein
MQSRRAATRQLLVVDEAGCHSWHLPEIQGRIHNSEKVRIWDLAAINRAKERNLTSLARLCDQKRSLFITLVQAVVKSSTNLRCASRIAYPPWTASC